MQVVEIDNVKIYNLSAGKSLPDVSGYFHFNYVRKKMISF